MPDAVHDYDPDADQFVLTCSPRARELAAQIPGNRAVGDEWRSPATLVAALTARSVFGQGLQPTERASKHVGWMLATDAWRAELLHQDPERIRQAYDLPDTLLPFQVPSVALMEHGPWMFQFDDRGNGKSVQAAATLERLDGPALIVCTTSMLYTWAEEVCKHAPSRTPFVLDGTKPKRLKTLAAAEGVPGAVIICTWKVLTLHSRHAPYGSVSLTEEKKAPKELNGGWIRHVIADEAHYAKSPKSERTRALWAVGDEADGVRIPMTATPISDSPADVWALLRFVDPDSWPSRTKFRDRYVHSFLNAHGGVEDLGFNMATKPELDRIVQPRLIRRPLQVSVSTLPPQTRWLTLTPKQKSAYKAMQKEMLAEIDGEILTASNAMIRDMRLHQIAAATPVVEEYEEPDPVTGAPVRKVRVSELVAPSCKLDALVDLLDEQGEDDPLVVFAESRKLIEMFHRELTRTEGKGPRLPLEQVGLITGTVSPAARTAQVAAFQNGEQRLMLLTIAAGSEGITLTRARTTVFAQRSYKELGNIQALGRVLRHGQERDVQVIDLVTLGTVEEKLHRAVAEKGDTMQEFLQDPDWVRHTLEAKP